jgi:hypothetical protein
MRDPDRIPLILAAVERRWRKDPDLRLGQLFANVSRRDMHYLFAMEDGELLRLLGPTTDEEDAYIEDEPRARREGWSEWQRWFRRQRPPRDEQ